MTNEFTTTYRYAILEELPKPVASKVDIGPLVVN